jgi:hypothetical protein
MIVTTLPSNTSAGLANLATGSFTTPATPEIITVICGFQPRRVELINSTTPTVLIKMASMSAGSTFRQVAAGTGTIQADHITLTEDGFTLAAAPAGASQTWHYAAQD